MTEKTEFKPRLRAEFSMGQYDYERINYIMMALDKVGIMVRMGRLEYLDKYIAFLKQLYLNIKPILYETKKKELDKMFRKAKVLYNDFSKKAQMGKRFATPLPDLLENIDEKLREYRQIMGLGITVRKELSERALMKKVLRVSK
jgi:hypothetical protein